MDVGKHKANQCRFFLDILPKDSDSLRGFRERPNGQSAIRAIRLPLRNVRVHKLM